MNILFSNVLLQFWITLSSSLSIFLYRYNQWHPSPQNFYNEFHVMRKLKFRVTCQLKIITNIVITISLLKIVSGHSIWKKN